MQVKLGNQLKVDVRRFIKEYKNELTIAGFVILIFLVSPFITPVFFSGTNLLNLLRQTSYSAIAAIGMYYVILTGGIDLSIGATIQIVGMVSITMLINNIPTFLTLVSIIIIGLIIGLINGTLITYGKLQPFVVTLVTKRIMEGTVLTITEGASISGTIPDSFMSIGTGYLVGIPIPVVVLAICLIFAFILMHKTIYGRRLYLTGSNSVAAFYSGINVNAMKVSAYILCALFATISGILSVARIGAFQPTTTHGGATGMEMNAIAAVVVGGGSLSGGKGTVIGVILGALLYGMLSNLFPLVGINSYIQQLVQGLIILIAVVVSARRLSIKPRYKEEEGTIE